MTNNNIIIITMNNNNYKYYILVHFKAALNFHPTVKNQYGDRGSMSC